MAGQLWGETFSGINQQKCLPILESRVLFTMDTWGQMLNFYMFMLLQDIF